MFLTDRLRHREDGLKKSECKWIKESRQMPWGNNTERIKCKVCVYVYSWVIQEVILSTSDARSSCLIGI